MIEAIVVRGSFGAWREHFTRTSTKGHSMCPQK